MNMKGILLFAVLILQLIIGCATVPMATESEDLEAKSFTAASDKSNIYVFRDSIVGTAVAFEIILEGQIIGNLPIKTFHLLKVAPGKHIVSAIFEDHSDLAELVTEPGYNYFIRASLDQQVFTRLPGVKLEIVDNAEGKEIVSQLKLAKSNYNE